MYSAPGVSRRELATQARAARDMPEARKRQQRAFIQARLHELVAVFNAFNKKGDTCVLLQLQQRTETGWIDV